MADISLLKTFLELSRSRHFGKTAKNLFLTQSAVSARIKILEDTLGVRLVTRDRNNIQLTPAGMRFLPYAESVLTTWNRARQEVGLDDENMQLLTMGAVSSLWETNLQPTLIKLRQEKQQLALNIEVHGSDNLLRLINEDMLDLAFLFESPQLKGMHSESIGSLELVMVSTQDGLSAEEAVNQSDYIMVDWGSSFAVNHAHLFPDMRPPMMRVSHGHLLINYLTQNSGSAYMPRTMVHELIENRRLFLVSDADLIYRSFYAVHSESCTRQALVDEVIEIAKNYSAN
ncbi:MAG: LysR substrate-binding domain-containing protein [Gammaproteobacteria bacterium]|nr:LysR substrate-binding domain-containing protein [Gammaproteobacteria bacterium]